MSQANIPLHHFFFSSGYCLPCFLVCSAFCGSIINFFPNASIDSMRETFLRAVRHTGVSAGSGSPPSPALPALVLTGCFLASFTARLLSPPLWDACLPLLCSITCSLDAFFSLSVVCSPSYGQSYLPGASWQEACVRVLVFHFAI